MASSPPVNPICPSNSTFTACDYGTRFLGCCLSTLSANEVCSRGCPPTSIQPASFEQQYYTLVKEGQCANAQGKWYSCADTKPPFFGCCNVDACQNGCPEGGLVAAMLSENQAQKEAYAPLVQGLVDESEGASENSATESAESTTTATRTLAVVTSSAPSSAVTSAAAASSSPSTPVLVGGVAGGVVGGVILSAILAALFVFWRRRKSSRAGKRAQDDSNNGTVSSFLFPSIGGTASLTPPSRRILHNPPHANVHLPSQPLPPRATSRYLQARTSFHSDPRWRVAKPGSPGSGL